MAKIDKRTQRAIPFSEIACDSALDAAECAALVESLDPRAQTLIGYRPEPNEVLVPHVCRGCNCQFDRNGRRVA